MAGIIICSDWRPKKIKSDTVSGTYCAVAIITGFGFPSMASVLTQNWYSQVLDEKKKNDGIIGDLTLKVHWPFAPSDAWNLLLCREDSHRPASIGLHEQLIALESMSTQLGDECGLRPSSRLGQSAPSSESSQRKLLPTVRTWLQCITRGLGCLATSQTVGHIQGILGHST